MSENGKEGKTTTTFHEQKMRHVKYWGCENDVDKHVDKNNQNA